MSVALRGRRSCTIGSAVGSVLGQCVAIVSSGVNAYIFLLCNKLVRRQMLTMLGRPPKASVARVGVANGAGHAKKVQHV